MLTGMKKYLKRAEEASFAILESFGGKQPSFHLYDIAIRHWDGYWFGKDRILWYPSTLLEHFIGYCSSVFMLKRLENKNMQNGLWIFSEHLCLFTEDGRGSCAFIYPNKVNGQKPIFMTCLQWPWIGTVFRPSIPGFQVQWGDAESPSG